MSWSRGIAGLVLASSAAWGASGDDGITVHLRKGSEQGSVSLRWWGGVSPYSVYRSTSPTNVATPINLLGTTGGPLWADTPPDGVLYFYYVEAECEFDGPDVCDGVDNDCDPATADGSQDPVLGTPCDGPDSDLCREGATACVAASLTCNDATGGEIEQCLGNGGDEDCDGTVDEGFPINTNPVCTDYAYLGAISGDLGGTLTISGNREGWFRVNLVESSSGFRALSAQFALYSPAGTDYDLYVRCQGCSGGTVGISQVRDLGGHLDTTFIRRDDTSRTDTFPVLIEVRNFAAAYCGEWQLAVVGNTGGPYNSCPNTGP